MNTYNHSSIRRSISCDEVVGALCQRPFKHLKRSSNKRDESTWINGHFLNSSIEFRRSRTSFEVSDTNHTTIAKRILGSNKNRSVYASYDGAIMRCKTPSHVIFTVRLVRLSQKPKTILVDVQRRRGCAILFRDEYQAIFQAAVNGETTPCEGPRSRTRSYLGDIDWTQIDCIPLKESDIERSLKASSAGIESKVYDARVLTLQDLLITTDPLSKETSPIACKLILEKYCNIFEYIVQDITKQVDYRGSDTYDHDSEEYLRSLTLDLLGNILTVVTKHNTLMSLIQDRQQIISSLLWYVGMARKCPSNASLAAKCLRLFLSASTDAMLVNDMDTSMTIENARRFGSLTNQNLEKEAKLALIAIQV
jgi:hypothetical protein